MTKRAFTLIELLVVIAIIGILVSAVIIQLQGTTEAASDAIKKSTLQTLASTTARLYQFSSAGGGYGKANGLCAKSEIVAVIAEFGTDGDGNDIFTCIDSGLEDGEVWSLSVVLENSDNVLISTSKELTPTLFTPPLPTYSIALAAEDDTGVKGDGETTQYVDLTFRGRSIPDATVRLFYKPGSGSYIKKYLIPDVATATVGEDGNWEITVSFNVDGTGYGSTASDAVTKVGIRTTHNGVVVTNPYADNSPSSMFLTISSDAPS